MKDKFWMIILAAAVVAMPGIAAAEKDGLAASDPKVPVVEQKMETDLGITPEQHQKMQALHDEAQAKQKALSDELQAKKAILRDELDADKPNRGKVDGLLADIKALQGKMMDNRVDQIFKTRAILTSEQFLKLKELRKKHQEESAAGKDKFKGKIKEKKKPAEK